MIISLPSRCASDPALPAYTISDWPASQTRLLMAYPALANSQGVPRLVHSSLAMPMSCHSKTKLDKEPLCEACHLLCVNVVSTNKLITSFVKSGGGSRKQTTLTAFRQAVDCGGHVISPGCRGVDQCKCHLCCIYQSRKALIWLTNARVAAARRAASRPDLSPAQRIALALVAVGTLRRAYMRDRRTTRFMPDPLS